MLTEKGGLHVFYIQEPKNVQKRPKMINFSKPVLLIDTREQTPLDFSTHADRFQHIIRSTLKEGDYSVYVPGDNRKIAFERKSLGDLVGTLIKGRDRFKRELDRLRPYDYVCLLIEATYQEVSSPYSFSRVNPSSVLGTLQSIQLQYGIDVVFAGSRRHSVEIAMSKIGAFYEEKG